MALPWPEGEALFLRSALRTSSFNPANNQQAFYGNALIEIAWNAYYSAGPRGPYKEAWREPTNPHFLSRFDVMWRNGWGTAFGRYEEMNILYGGQNLFDVRRKHRLITNDNFWEYRDYDLGQAKICFMPIPMPTLEEQFLWIDLTIPVRAIYFPLAWKCADRFEHLCSYLMLDFRQGVMRVYHETGWVDRQLNLTRGIGPQQGHMVRIDVPGIYELLAIPRHERAPGKAVTHPGRLIELKNSGPCAGRTTESFMGLTNWVDLVDIVNAHHGVNLQYTPTTHQPWVANMIRGFAAVAIGLIPGIGPLLALSFEIGMQAIMNPDAFRAENILGLAPDILDAIIGSASKSKPNVRPGRFSGEIETASDVSEEDKSSAHNCTGWLEARLPPAPKEDIPPHPDKDSDEYEFQTQVVEFDPVVETDELVEGEVPQPGEPVVKDQSNQPNVKEKTSNVDAEEDKGA